MDTHFQQQITKQTDRLCNGLNAQVAESARLRPYFELSDAVDIPAAITAAKLAKRYRYLMERSRATWGVPIVAAKLDRLEVNGITDPDKRVALAVWDGVWQENDLNLISKRLSRACLRDGKSFATVWPGNQWLLDGDGGVIGSDRPEVVPDDCTTMIVEYAEGSLRRRKAALRRWTDDDNNEFVNLYRPDGIYKFVAVKESVNTQDAFSAGGRRWVPREVLSEPWPLPNPLKVVPVVEFGVNGDISSGSLSKCRGEYANVTSRLDAINLLTFLGLDIAVSMSYPLRILFGDVESREDDDGNPLPPFDAYSGGISHIPDSDGKIAEFKAADRGALSLSPEFQQVASLTATPKHYFPNEGVIANVSAETITAFEAPMLAAVRAEHQPSLAVAYEEVLRLGGRLLPGSPMLSRRAAITWADHQSRSLGEQASAFAQLTGGENAMPMAFAAQIALGLGQDKLRELEEAHADSAFAQVVSAVRDLQADPAPVPAVA